ncbi:MAG: PilT/PilU family type 4a pilus ATPase [bacterium]
MAQLDRLLAVLAGNKSGVLTLDEGNLARFQVTGTGDSQPVTRLPLTGPQILSLLNEVAPPDSARNLAQGAPASFTYVSTEGSFSTSAELTDGRWRVRIGSTDTPVLALVTDLADDPMDEPIPDDALQLVPGSYLVASEVAAGVGSPAHDRIQELLQITVSRGASDLHLRVGDKPILRRHGEIIRLFDAPVLRADDVAALIDATIPHVNRVQLMESNDTDYAYEIAALGRFRVNAFKDRLGSAAVFRHIPPAIVNADDLGLSSDIQALCSLTRGLVLVTGPTGSGKSTTLCALIDRVNRTRNHHIITIEDPIEFVHPSLRCVVSQRQIGMHTRSFKSALRAALREDPDVVLIGEMRDLETTSIALETAETGHLVFASLHTTTAATTLDRIIDQFPPNEQEQIRVMLADSLRSVISQTLVKRIGGGRIAAREVMFNTVPVANLIRERKTFQIPSVVQTSKRLGMLTMNDALLELIDAHQVEIEEAYIHATDKKNFIGALKAKGYDTTALEIGIGVGVGAGRLSGSVRP